jgi:hypothetical protein
MVHTKSRRDAYTSHICVHISVFCVFLPLSNNQRLSKRLYAILHTEPSACDSLSVCILVSTDSSLTYEEFCALVDATIDGDVHMAPLPTPSGKPPSLSASPRAKQARFPPLVQADAAVRLRDMQLPAGTQSPVCIPVHYNPSTAVVFGSIGASYSHRSVSASRTNGGCGGGDCDHKKLRMCRDCFNCIRHCCACGDACSDNESETELVCEQPYDIALALFSSTLGMFLLANIAARY